MYDYCELIKIVCVASSWWQAATMQKSHAFLKGSWSYACVKIAFEFFLLITNWYYLMGLELFFLRRLNYLMFL